MNSEDQEIKINRNIRNLSIPKGQVRDFLGQESGQSLIVLVLSMTAILAMMALAIDGGFAYAMHTRMQTAADTAALSGARELALGNSNGVAIDRANQILAANGGDPDLSTVTITGRQVDVATTTLFDTFFAGILGIDQMTISASSAAVWGSVKAMGGVLPIVVPQDQWIPGETVTLWDQSNCKKQNKKDCSEEDYEDSISPGNWGWVRLGDKNTSLAKLVANPPAAQLQITDWVSAKPGTVDAALQAVKSYWLGQKVTLVLYKKTNGLTGSNLEYQISGFAQFEVTEVNAQGNPKYILGEFIDYVQLGGTIDPTVGIGNTGVALVPPSGAAAP